jgi:hypothetical protein
MTDPTPPDEIATTLDLLASMLGPEWATLARRLRDARRQLLDDARPDLSDATIRALRDVQRGTMGGLTDVTLGSLVDGRWVVDEPRERQFDQLVRSLGKQVSGLRSPGT